MLYLNRLWWYLVPLAIFISVSSCFKLNVPRVLLPLFDEVSTNFTLEVTDGGCYRWSPSREDVIQLTPVNVNYALGCSPQVVVSAITKEAKRNTVIVFAEEVNSKQVIPCDVIVDVIHSLKIVTQTRELYVEEAPEVFEVRAQDDQGNEFTTLQGVEFDWAVSQLSSSGGVSSVMRFMSFKDSPYDTPASVAHFDRIGVRGHIILLEGVKTGSAKVSVRLSQKEYQHIATEEVQLMVVANLIIDPADVYLLPGDSVKYRVLQVRHGRLREIELPSQQYYLEVEDSEIALLNAHSSEAQGLKEGRTVVSLRDRNVSPSETGMRVPTATLTVALPSFLHLTLLPYRNWAVLVDDTHAISVEVYDKSNHRFHGDGMRVKVSIPPKYFHVESSTLNGTYTVGWGIEAGTARVEAVLEVVVSSSGVEYPLQNKISTQEDMLIFPRMEIHPKEVVLPWDPHMRARYEVMLRCLGGDGSLLWSSTNSSVAVVTQAGVLRTQMLGESNITAAMKNNPHNRASASVKVLPPSHLRIIDQGLDAEVGAPIHIQVAIYAVQSSGGKKLPFTMCNELPLKVTVWDENFVHEETVLGSPSGDACTTVTVIGRSLGTSKVSISYRESGIHLEDSVTVAAYRPLTVLHPSNAETVLALGTSRQLVFEGGPRPWPGRGYEHGKTTSVGDGTKATKEMIEVSEVANVSSEFRDRYIYTVLCRTIGETSVTLTVFSEGRTGERVESSAMVRVFCAKPRFASLTAVLNIEDNSACPMNVNAERIAVQSSKDLELELRVSDVHGRTFDNVSSVLMEWTANPSMLSIFNMKDGTFSEELHEKGLVLPLRHYQVVHPLGETGAVEITVRLTGYKSAVLRPKQITPEWPPFAVKGEKGAVTPDIKASLSLLFVSDTIVHPNYTTMFNHPSSVLILEVSQGSGYFEPQLESQDVALVRYQEHTQTLEVRPRATGVARFGLVDLCLPSRPAIVTVTVVGVHTLVLDVADRLQQGKQALCTVQITDTIGNPLQLSDMSLLELRPHLEGSSSSIVSLKDYESDNALDKELGITGPARPGEFRFVVNGLKVGDASLFFTTGHDNYEVRSPIVTIRVFSPLRLYPRNMTLLVGSQMHVTVSGGPPSGLQLEFSLAPSGFAQVSESGVVEGERIGHTQLTGRAVGFSKVTGSKIIFSEDTVDVFVVPLTGIRIDAPLTHLKVNAKMPVWVSGLPDPLSPLVLGSTRPALAFEWDLSSREVADLSDVLEETGIEVTDEHRVSVRVRALSAGRTTLYLSVFAPATMTGTPKGELFEETLILEVYEELKLTHPLSITDQDFSGLLVAPETEMQLRSNRDGLTRVFYSLHGYPTVTGSDMNTRDPSPLLPQQSPLLSVSPNGLVTTHTSTGRAAVVVTSIDETNVKQSLGLSIEVKPVHYIMTSVRSQLQISPGASTKALPRGFELQLEVSYHDNTGTAFAATRTDLNVRASRADLIQMSRSSGLDQLGTNSSLRVNLIHTGDSVLHISDHLTPSQASDFFKLPIEEFIFPSKTKVTVGDVICFSMQVVTSSGEMGHWSSDSSDILSLDHDSGLGRARLPGSSVFVKYHLADHVVSSTELEVVPVQSMVFLGTPDGYLLNKATASKGAYRVGLVLSGEHENNKQGNLIARGADSTCADHPPLFSSFPFSCEARFNSPGITTQLSEVFQIQPVYDHNEGYYACELVPIGLSSSEISRLQTNVTLRARAVSWAGEAVSAPLVLPFLPILHLSNPEITLTGGSPGYLEVLAVPEVLSQLHVVAMDDTLVLVSMLYSSENSAQYQVSLTNKFWTQAALNEQQFVFVISALTDQNIKVPIRLRLDPEQWSAPCLISPVGSLLDVAYSHRHVLIVVVSLIIVALATLYIYVTFIQPALRTPNQAFLQSSPHVHCHSFVSARSNPGSPDIFLNRSAAFSDSEPVYGDPRLYYESPRRRML